MTGRWVILIFTQDHDGTQRIFPVITLTPQNIPVMKEFPTYEDAQDWLLTKTREMPGSISVKYVNMDE